jgi:hypothetical protein
VKVAGNGFGSNLEADDLMAWSEISAETLAYGSFCKMGRQLMNLEPVTKEVPLESNSDDSCIVVPILKPNARKYHDLTPNSWNREARVDMTQ